MMASKYQLLAVAILALSASAATHDGPVGFIMQMGLPDGSKTEEKVEVDDEVTAKEAADEMQEVLDDEKPLLKDEMEDEEIELRESSVELAKEEGGAKKVTVKKEGGGKKVVWASEFEKDVTELVMGLSKSGMGATPMGSSVQKISELIEKDMMPKVWKAHKSNQEELNRLAAELAKCGNQKDLAVKTALRQKTSYQSSSKLHKTCRIAEASLYTENVNCHNTWKGKKQVKDLKCKIYSETSKRTGEQNANKQIVSKGGSESVEVYVTRISATICGKARTRGNGGHGQGGLLDKLLDAKGYCERATQDFNKWDKQCKSLDKRWHNKKSQCNNVQDQMDDASCKWAIDTKDACESYSECHMDRKRSHEDTVKMVKTEEHDRKAEWRGLMRMQCLIKAFRDGKVKNSEIRNCKKKTHSTEHLNIEYPHVPEFQVCSVPNLYPATPAYKLAEFAPLPAFAKGKQDANTCVGIIEINTVPNPGPRDGMHLPACRCERVTLNGPYSAGALVKCNKCRAITGPRDTNSCPEGTKIFSPRTELDWKTIYSSVELMVQDPSDERNPRNRSDYVIVDVSSARPAKESDAPMNSYTPQGMAWHTSDGSPWWLRSTVLEQNGTVQPHGGQKGYSKGCYLGVKLAASKSPEGNLEFESRGCMPRSDSYFCQAIERNIVAKPGSPEACKCDPVVLTGPYSAGALIKCTNCLDVSKSTQKNSCPMGTKLFSPQNGRDWKTFLSSAGPLRSPHWIIDITRSLDGCGGCKKHAMKSSSPAQMTWRTADGSPWWLRSSTYTEPSGDYKANCYMDLWKTPVSEQGIMFNDHNCVYHSNAYYCQPVAGPPGHMPGMPPPMPGMPGYMPGSEGMPGMSGMLGDGGYAPPPPGNMGPPPPMYTKARPARPSSEEQKKTNKDGANDNNEEEED